MRFLPALLAVLLHTVVLVAWAGAQTAPPDPIGRGYELLASGLRQEAVRHFESLLAGGPDNLPAGFGALAARHARLEYDDSEQSLFEKRLDHFIDTATTRYGRSRNDEEALFYLAQAHMLRGGYRFEYDKGMWGAARDGAKAKSYSETYVARQPHHADAYLTLGLYNYYVALAPSLFKVVGRMLFLPAGNRAEGLKQLERAAAAGTWFAPRARLVLMGIYGTTEHRPAEALALGRALRQRYPGNDTVSFALADLHLAPAFEDRDEAAALYQHVIDRNRRDATIDAESARLRATLALAAVRQEQWRLDEAIALVTPIVQSGVTRPAWALPQALLRRSNYRALLDDAAAAEDAKVLLGNPKIAATWREAARAQLKWIDQRRSSGESAMYAALVPGNRLVAEKQWAAARQAYEPVRVRDPQNPQVRYRLAYLTFASGDAERALPEMAALAAAGKGVPDWIKAGALLVTARAHDLAGRRDQARRAYQTIVDRYEEERPAAAARLGLITAYVRPA
jgi:hypothetical protein